MLFFKLDSSNIRPWDPQPNAAVHAIEYSQGKLYVAGAFSHMAGSPRKGAASITTADQKGATIARA